MRVLNVSSGNLYGGIERFLTTLATYGNTDEIEFEFALCFNGKLSEELSASGSKVHSLGSVRISNPLSVIQARTRLRDLLRSSKFDCVICHAAWPQAIFAPAIKAAAIKQVFWIHDATTGSHWLDKWASRTKPDRIICNSVYTMNQVSWLAPKVTRSVIYCPVPPQVPIPTCERQALRSELQVDSNTAVVILTSRLEPWKGHRMLLRALANLNDSDKFACWILGGAQRQKELDYLEELKALTADLNLNKRVFFLGQRADVTRLLGAADIHCQPNEGPEPFGIAFVEALQAGLPVITTDLGAASEILDSTCGILVPPQNVEKLAEALHFLISDAGLRKKLGIKGPGRAQELCAPRLHISNLQRCLAS